jgi:cell division transport system permease protein
VINLLRIVGFVIGSLLCLAVLFIVTNTIKLAIYARRDEIEILTLVGASDWAIKAPFLIEGAIQGMFSGLIALGILLLMYLLFSLERIQVLGLPPLNMVFLPTGYLIFVLSLSLLLGLVGSLIAVGRFFEL